MKEPKVYIGTKIVKGTPMNRLSFLELKGTPYSLQSDHDEPGYMVEYEDGYKSWSPKDIFERSYREVTKKEAAMVMFA